MKLFGRSIQIQRVIICALASLLAFYHTYTLYDLYLGSGTDLYNGRNAGAQPLFAHVQSILRVGIICSLLLVIMNRRPALVGMWACISTLIASQYWALFFGLPFHFLVGRHPLSYLKGFIIPTVITLLFLSNGAQRSAGKGA